MSEQKICQVLFPTAIDYGFDYLVDQNLQIGDIVEAPLRNGSQIGIIHSENLTQLPRKKIKSVIRKLEIATLPANLISFLNYVAKYNLIKTGLILKMAFSPKEIFKFHQKQIFVSLGKISDVKITKQREKIFEYLKQHNSYSIEQLVEDTGVSRNIINSLIKSSALISQEKQLPLIIPEKKYSYVTTNFNTKQQEAIDLLLTKIRQKSFSTTLINGITGSGKTEIYFRAIAEILEKTEQQILILLPEILLTKQFIDKFLKRFGVTPDCWHSNSTASSKKLIWHGVLLGKTRIVVGARSALFLPFSSLGLIIIDEEHDSSYKQEEGTVYHARDMAIVRAMKEKCPIFLVTATPSLETRVNVDSGKYDECRIGERFGESHLPAIELIDMKKQVLPKDHWISDTLKAQMTATLAKNQQIMIFLNRRGYAPLIICTNCGYRFKCNHCDSFLVEHRQTQKLLCHHCDHSEIVPEKCHQCNQPDSLHSCGPGVERIADEIAEYFPDENISLITSDIVNDLTKMQQLFHDIESSKSRVIIGTQMVAKGHHFPNLTLIGVIDGDMGTIGDFRCTENIYQMLCQLAGRAGRDKHKGQVLIQTYQTDSEPLTALAEDKAEEFWKQEIENRRLTELPPFSYLVALIISGKNRTHIFNAAQNIAENLVTPNEVELMGPIAAPLHFLRNKYRFRILLKSTKPNLQNILRYNLAQIKLDHSISLKIDIDPYSFY